MITGVKLTCYISLWCSQYGMANSIEGSRMISTQRDTIKQCNFTKA